MSRYGNLGAFDYKVTNVPQYDLEADINKGIERGIKFGQMIASAKKSKEIERQKEIANQIALDKLDKATREGLILPADSSTTSLNNARIDFSNKLVDKLNQAKIMRDDGSLTAADYSKIVMTLESQIPAYKAAEKVINGGMSQYLDALEDGKLSKANSAESIEFWSAISTGRANIDYAYDENGNMEMVGTWTDSEGKKQPIKAALERFEQLPFILDKPEATAAENRQADVKNILDTKEGSTLSKLSSKTGPGGAPIYETDIQTISYKDVNGDEVLKPWFKQFGDDSFNSYFDSLGKGDLRMGLKQYLLDSEVGFGDYESVNFILQNKSVDELNKMKVALRDQYVEDLKLDVLKANNLRVQELNEKALGDVAAYARDESTILRNQQLKKEISTPKSDGKTTKTDDTLLARAQALVNKSSTFGEDVLFPINKPFDYKEIIKDTGINIDNAKITITKKGMSETTEDPNNFVMSVPGGKSIKISKEDLYDTREFMRNYFAALGIPNKATKNQPSIDDYLDNLDFTGENIAKKYNIDGSK